MCIAEFSGGFLHFCCIISFAGDNYIYILYIYIYIYIYIYVHYVYVASLYTLALCDLLIGWLLSSFSSIATSVS